ncbi:hypothetical protein ACTXT7_017146, partial [Hymenolepis weldensis]
MSTEIPGGMFSNDFKPILFSYSSSSNHTPGKKFYQFVKCLLFGDCVLASEFTSHMRLQRVDDNK